MNERDVERETYDELCSYTIAHPDPSFIHQHAVDAFAAQHADKNTKPITLAFALIGLYLQQETNASGKQVQRVHMLLAQRRKAWPRFDVPDHRGDITVLDVMAAPPGPERDDMIVKWCASVWDAYRDSRKKVVDLLKSELG